MIVADTNLIACVARELSAPLVTSDRKLLRAFPGVALSMEQFAAG